MIGGPYQVGEKSKAICKRCQQLRDTTFVERDVSFGSASNGGTRVLVGVCDACDDVVSIPQQSIDRVLASPSEASRIYQAAISVLVDDKDWAQNLVIREVLNEDERHEHGEPLGTRYIIEAQVNRFVTDESLNKRILDACTKWTLKSVEVLIRYAGPGGAHIEEAKANHLRLVDVPKEEPS